MPDTSILMLFVVACLALTATPGPDMLLIASRSASQGPRAGFATLMGIQTGTYCHALAAALGLSQLFLVVPVAYDAVRYAGAAYLLYLAFKAFRTGGMTERPSTEDIRYPVSSMFQQGLFTNLLNPKMALFVLALFPQFVRPDAGSVVLQMIILATVLNGIGLIVNGAVIVAAGRFAKALARGGRFRRLPHMLLGVVFTSLAVRLIFDGRK